MNYLIACIITISCLLFLQPVPSGRSTLHRPAKSAESPCVNGSFTVKGQPDAPARLTMTEALCDGPSWKARLTLVNTSDKVITGYDVANVEEYEHEKGVKSSQGVNGITLEPGKSEEVTSGGGFRGRRSYGKQTGTILKNVFRLTRIEFADGSTWQEKKDQ